VVVVDPLLREEGVEALLLGEGVLEEPCLG